MKDWCKIIQTESHDVVVQLGANDKDGDHVKISIRDNSVDVSVVITGEDESEAKRMYSEIEALHLVGIMHSMGVENFKL